MIRLILKTALIFLFIGLGGCAVIGVGYGGFESIDTEIDNPNLASFSLNNCRSVWPDTHGVFHSLDKILEHWGEPDEMYFHGKEQHLLYEKDLIWSGVSLALVIIPIPLKIPTGREYCEVVIIDEKASKLIHHRSGKDWFIGCWVYPEFHTGNWKYGCGKKKS